MSSENIKGRELQWMLWTNGYPPGPGTGYPPDLGLGTPTPPSRTWDWAPPQTWDQVSPLDLGPGTPLDLGPGTPQTWDRVPPPWPGTQRVLAMRRAVCLLRSRRRTFLLSRIFNCVHLLVLFVKSKPFFGNNIKIFYYFQWHMYIILNLTIYFYFKSYNNTQLEKRGFENINALDLCKEMLQLAKAKNIYKKMYCAAITTQKTIISDGNYFSFLYGIIISPFYFSIQIIWIHIMTCTAVFTYGTVDVYFSKAVRKVASPESKMTQEIGQKFFFVTLPMHF